MWASWKNLKDYSHSCSRWPSIDYQENLIEWDNLRSLHKSSLNCLVLTLMVKLFWLGDSDIIQLCSSLSLFSASEVMVFWPQWTDLFLCLSSEHETTSCSAGSQEHVGNASRIVNSNIIWGHRLPSWRKQGPHPSQGQVGAVDLEVGGGQGGKAYKFLSCVSSYC